MIVRIFELVGALFVVGLAAGRPARGEALRPAAVPTGVPMTRADGEVCDLLRAQAGDQCKRLAHDGAATVYQSGTRANGIHRIVLAIDTGRGVLISPPIDLVADQLQSTHPTLRAVAIDGRPGVVLEVVSTWKRGAPAQRTGSLVGCTQDDAIWKCATIELGELGELGACDAGVTGDGRVTSCGTERALSIAPDAAGAAR